MSLFKISDTLDLIEEKPFKLEKEIQVLTEHNLHKIFKLVFVKSELSIDNFRIDTLAFDEESKSFLIIEYKKDKSFSVIDQGYAYLSLMLNNKADNEKVLREVKVHTEQDHLEKGSDEIVDLYIKFRDAIINLGDVTIKPKKLYLAFVKARNIVDIHVQKNKIKMWINLRKGELEDPKKITKDVSSVGHWGNGDYELIINSDDDLEYILSLIKQSLKYHEQ